MYMSKLKGLKAFSLVPFMMYATQLCMIFELVLMPLCKALLMLDKVIANWPILRSEQMSQNEGQRKVASEVMQPLNKEEIRLGSPEGMKERRRGDETQEDEC